VKLYKLSAKNTLKYGSERFTLVYVKEP